VTARTLAATGAVRGFTAAIAATGIGALVAVLTSAALAWVIFRDRTDETAEAIKRARQESEEYIRTLQKLDGASLRAERQVMKQRADQLEAERERIQRELADLPNRTFEPETRVVVSQTGIAQNVVARTADQVREQERLRL